MRKHLLVAAFACAIGAPCESTFAQTPGRDTIGARAALAGVISDTLDRPIARAEVVVDGTDLMAVSDDSGRFHLAGVPAGRNGFIVRKIGYTVVSFETTLAPDKTLVVDVRLRSAQSLEAALITGERLLPGLARAGFYERERQAFGKYLRPEKIDSMSYVGSPSQFLREMPGIEVRCGNSSRCSVRSRTPPYCMHLFIDGRYAIGGSVESSLDDLLTPGAIGAMEVYRHPSSVPHEFQAPLLMKAGRGVTGQAGCGVIAVWTKLKVMR